MFCYKVHKLKVSKLLQSPFRLFLGLLFLWAMFGHILSARILMIQHNCKVPSKGVLLMQNLDKIDKHSCLFILMKPLEELLLLLDFNTLILLLLFTHLPLSYHLLFKLSLWLLLFASQFLAYRLLWSHIALKAKNL